MDNNQTPSQPLQQEPVAQPTEQKANRLSKKIFIIGAIVVLLVIIAGAAYWYRQNQAANIAAVEQFQKTTQSLEKELNSLDRGDIEKDFSEVDTDLQSL